MKALTFTIVAIIAMSLTSCGKTEQKIVTFQNTTTGWTNTIDASLLKNPDASIGSYLDPIHPQNGSLKIVAINVYKK